MQAREYAAAEALDLINATEVLGLGTGRAVEALIALLPTIRLPKQIVSSSVRTTKALEAQGIDVTPFNQVDGIDLYIDGADQVLRSGVAIKGGGGAHTMEKCLATSAKHFVGLIDSSKLVEVFDFPVPVEVIPASRSMVARHIASLYGHPVYREGFKTDAMHVILDVTGMSLVDPLLLEQSIQLIPGVVDVGIFAHRRFDQLIVGLEQGVEIIDCKET